MPSIPSTNDEIQGIEDGQWRYSIFKYVTKGLDRAKAKLHDEYNEEKGYQNLRSIGASETCCRLSQFDITTQHPTVQALRIHVEGEQYITFKEGQEANVAQQDANCTELIAIIAYDAANP